MNLLTSTESAMFRIPANKDIQLATDLYVSVSSFR